MQGNAVNASGNPIFAQITAGTAVVGYVTNLYNDILVSPTVQNSSYSAGNSLGGLQTVTLFLNTTQPSALLSYVSAYSKGGSTVGMTVFAFDSNPTSSTCSDKSAYTVNVADISKLIPGFPVVLTPAIAQSMAETAASAQLASPVKNQNGTRPQAYLFAL